MHYGRPSQDCFCKRCRRHRRKARNWLRKYLERRNARDFDALLSAIAGEIEKNVGDKYSEPDLGDLRALAGVLREEEKK